MDTDASGLVQLCLKGDDDAWRTLIQEYGNTVYSICRAFSGSTSDTEDLAQDAFLKIWMNLSNFDPVRGDLRTWIAAVTRHRGIDRFRQRAQTRITDSMDEGWDEPDGTTLSYRIADMRPTAHDSALANEVGAIFSRAVDGIPPDYREVATLRFVHDFDNREIAFRLGIPEGTVKSRVNRGRAKLVSILTPMRAALTAG